MIPYTAERGWRDTAGKLRACGRSAPAALRVAILLQNAFEAAALVRLAGIPRRIGYDRDGRGWLLTDAIAVPKPGEIPPHQRFYYLELLRRAGLIESLPEATAIHLGGAVEAAQAGRQNFEAAGWSGLRV